MTGVYVCSVVIMIGDGWSVVGGGRDRYWVVGGDHCCVNVVCVYDYYYSIQ